MTSAVSTDLHGTATVNTARCFTVGVEEEFVLVDPDSGEPALTNTLVAAEPDVDLQLELSRCQIETCTPVCTSIPELHREIRRARAAAAAAAARTGSLMLATGVPLREPPPGSITDTPRYQRMAERFGVLAEQVICGCHVHIGVADRELAVQVSNHIRPWLPTLLALTANSPITAGADTGQASWRHRLWARWPSAGPPPYFDSAAHYDEIVAELADSGRILDPRMVYWDVRLSDHLPTIEIRISDVPATTTETALLAALVRALVSTSVAAVEKGWRAAPVDRTVLRAACDIAARRGLTGSRAGTRAGEPGPIQGPTAHLLGYLRPALEESGDYDFARAALAAVLAGGNGAVRQRDAHRAGDLRHVQDMLSHLTTEGCADENAAR
ncbi:glutamate--cysteine ligase [Nocardia sp. NPDC050697]|uniref:carboxylate-amine ligase n=1 Tax=Nocardia sp. NPDC050697 TaxID=3155158 RepID=UPI0033EB1157